MQRVVEERVIHDDIHHVHDNDNETSNSFWGLIVLLIILILFFVYGLPAIRNMSSGPSVNVPGTVNVNVHQPTK